VTWRRHEPVDDPEAEEEPVDIPAETSPPPAAETEAEAEARRRRPRRARSPGSADRLYRKFGGAYPALVEVLLQPRPGPVSLLIQSAGLLEQLVTECDDMLPA